MSPRHADAERPAIRLERVSKAYRLYRRPAQRILDALFGIRLGRIGEHLAVDDVTLTIGRGETVGLLGVNGAGKSTLLEIIVGTLMPSAGRVEVNGVVAALLELGAGFNPEWTGRENVVFHCRTLGLAEAEIPARLAAVESFAAVGEYFDQPLRTYSTGMFLRVAFAAAITSDPDILIIDEALAVGDARFQMKCFARFEELQRAGHTILFVTHAPELVARFCNRGLILEGGRLIFDGSAAEASRRYLAFLYGPAGEIGGQVGEAAAAPVPAPSRREEPAAAHLQDEAAPRRPAPAPILDPIAAFAVGAGSRSDRLSRRAFHNPHEQRVGDGRARIIDAAFLSGDPPGSHLIEGGSEVVLALRLAVARPIAHPTIGLVVKTPDNVTVFGSSTGMRKQALPPLAAGSEAIATVRFAARLLAGDYFLDIGLGDMVDGAQQSVDFRLAAIHVHVTAPADAFGLADLEPHFCLVQREDGS